MDKITVPMLAEMKRKKLKIVALTSYDYTTTQLLNEGGIDLLLVGDSLGMVKLGYDSTLPVTVDDMAYHTRIVVRGNSRALVVTDMPYSLYHPSPQEAGRHAGGMTRPGVNAWKGKGGAEMGRVIRELKAAKIRWPGHPA